MNDTVDGHLSELILLLLADGEVAPAAAAAHAAKCAFCGARLTTLRAEAEELTASFALDDGELAFLLEAALPARTVASLAPVPVVIRASNVAQRLEAMGVVAACVVLYTGWLVIAPALSSLLVLAGRAGATEVLANVVAGWLFQSFAFIGGAYGVFFGVWLPALGWPVLMAFAVLTWVLLLLLHRRTPAPLAAS